MWINVLGVGFVDIGSAKKSENESRSVKKN
jgi:hypothetical protein